MSSGEDGVVAVGEAVETLEVLGEVLGVQGVGFLAGGATVGEVVETLGVLVGRVLVGDVAEDFFPPSTKGSVTAVPIAPAPKTLPTIAAATLRFLSGSPVFSCLHLYLTGTQRSPHGLLPGLHFAFLRSFLTETR